MMTFYADFMSDLSFFVGLGGHPGQEVLRGILLLRTPKRDFSNFSRGTVSYSLHRNKEINCTFKRT